MGKPKIRFKGYEDAWEQRKLEEYLGVSKEKNRDESFGKDDVLSVSGEYGIVNQIEFQGRSFAGASVANYGVVEGGDVVYTKSPLKSNPYGIIKTNKGKTGIVSTLYAVYKPKNNVGAEFVQIYFELDSRMNSYMHPLVNKGAKNDMKVSDENALKGSVIFPKIDEQKAISKYFAQLDHLITLHQRKCYRFIDIALDAWEQRKLDSWGTFYYGRSCPKWSVTEDATIPCIRYGELYTKFGAKIDRVYSYTNMPPENLRFSKGTEVLIPRVGEDPMDYNHCTWLSMPDVAIGEMISVFNTDNNPLFTATMFNATLQNEFAMRVEGGSVTNLYFEKLKNIEVSFPSIQEQEKIAAYFENLDHLITLHQRKCEETKSLKKYMLQKMFPENGKCVPEIRFSGFSDAWEQRKLGEMIKEYKETVDSDCILPVLTSSKTEGVILQEEHFGRKQQHDITGYNILPRNYCTYRNRSDGVDFTFNINKCCDKGIISKFYPVFSGNNSDVFFISLLLNNSDEIVQEIAYTCTGTGQKVLSFLDLQKMKIKVPNFEEQKKIAAYFDHLDHLITLHQHKCDELQKLKKFMLQNMFV